MATVPPLLRILNGFERLSDANLILRGRNIFAKMLNNPAFATPVPSLSIIESAINDFEASATKAINGSKEDKEQRDANKEVLVALMHQLGNYVLFTANGNRMIAASSGFTINKIPQPQAPVAAAQDLRLVPGTNKGELKLTFDAQRSAIAYIYQYTTDVTGAEGSWTSVYGSLSKRLFTGLQSGSIYYFKVGVIGRGDQVVYSETVSSGVA